MKKREITITELQNNNGTHSISVNNVGSYPEILNNIILFIKKQTYGKEVFLGHYKIDGIYLTDDQMNNYNNEILGFFNANGKYQTIDPLPYKNKKSLYAQNNLVICQSFNNDDLYKVLKKVFHYYLETILFVPKISWDTFMSSYKNYMSGVVKDYVIKGYTDLLFTYADSGDFSVCFDPRKYDVVLIREEIEKLLNE